MKEVDNLINDGMYLSEFMNHPATLPMLSLEIGLRAYFSTYHQVSLNFFLFSKDGLPVKEEDDEYPISYYTSCFETIIHFQHFAELVCKAFLRDEHPLLALESAQNTSIFYKLLNNLPISSEEQDNLKSVEFSKSLERICKLAEITTNKENKVRYSLFAKWRKPLEQLNILRNRLWHRGTFILRYSALDKFIGAYILPFISEIVSLPEYQNSEAAWKYKPLYCGIDPLSSIVEALKNNSQYSRHQIAFLKELGNSAYNNPLWIGPLFSEGDPIAAQRNDFLQKTIETDALIALENKKATKITNCPVCGIKSLLITEAYVTCVGCNFRSGIELGNPKLYGFNFPETWFS